ncbi:MAG TPA: hypothetical protein DGG95_06975 [Cytophagales bacterium]|jgi:poly-beta-1,6-N-acetyl-D-glucosamine synthase|nr:hypothetical protein [Cytophagales bacterium]
MDVYFGLVFGLYFIFLIALCIGWLSALQTKPSSSSNTILISVVVAVRNESKNIDRLLESLAAQNYPRSNFEIILVDDHSEDDSVSKMEKWLSRINNLKIVHIPGESHGKKAALSHAIHLASGEIIATTDADCILPSNWLTLINQDFAHEKTNMLIGAVAINDATSFFNSLQSVEFASVIGTGISLAALGKPTMCNGANLSFRRKTFFEVKGYLGNENIASGDDEFLMRKILEKYPNSIQVLNPSECVVVTAPQNSLNDFIQQRLRWAGKWKVNSSVFSKSLAVVIILVQLSWMLLIAASLFNSSSFLITILLSKVLGELVFLRFVSGTLKVKFNLISFLLLQFIYPSYVLGIGFLSQASGYRWKGRSVT